jgi:biopolymer transport protein TolQ
VWGIMNSFFQIGQQQSSSLSVVAPGISEALFATAVGLFAAIPAVIGYNRYSHMVNSFEAHLQRFADRFHASLSRELDGL